jgi:hypothetical protein
MAWEEYNDLFYSAQDKGKYHLFIFDIKNSRNGYSPLEIQMLRNAIFSRLKLLENELGIEILHIPFEEGRGNRDGILGDVFSIVIYRDTISNDEIYKIFIEEKNKLNITHEFHYDDGYYETDDWTLGNELYYREYGISFLEDRSKKKEIII